MQKIIEDTRQQIAHDDKHTAKHAWWKRHGIEVVRTKLDAGDYMAEGSNILVDTKRSISEVAMNVGRDHKRFVRELDRAAEAGCRLVVLIEAGAPYRELEDIRRWTAVPCQKCDRRRAGACIPHSSMGCHRFRSKPMQGPTVYRIMKTLEADHGCRFELVHPAAAAGRICELLGVEVDGCGGHAPGNAR